MERFTAPERIRKLDENVVNRIAAGEVIQRASSAIKELLENCLDAGAKHINIVIKSGGLDLLQISDDGCGIARDDLRMLCERFTTSKLKTFEDLTRMDTFGFRGEALASISHVANMRVLTRTADSPCAYSARYESCCMLEEPTAVAGLIGTTITVENLFYNLPTRREALHSTDEQQRILDVVGRYAVEYGDRGVSFTVKKHGKTAPELHSSSLSAQGGSLAAIRAVFGSELARELLPLNRPAVTLSGLSNESLLSTMTLTIRGFVSRPSQVISRRSAGLLLFINGRLVDCPALRKVVEGVYQPLLPTQSKPFVYISLILPPQSLDVNVHPTKREVAFLHEQAIVSAVHDAVLSTLQASPGSRAFEVQSITDSSSHTINVEFEKDRGENKIGTSVDISLASSTPIFQQRATAVQPSLEIRTNTSNKKRSLDEEAGRFSSIQGNRNTSQSAQNKMVRTEIGFRNLKAYFPSTAETSTQSSNIGTGCECCGKSNNFISSVCQDCDVSQSVAVSTTIAAPSFASFELTSSNLVSVTAMIDELQLRRSESLVNTLKVLDYVGTVGRDHSLAQCGTGLMLVNHSRLLAELCRQLCILRFGEMEEQHIAESINGFSLRELLELAVSTKSTGEERIAEHVTLSEAAVTVLIHHREMLQEYFRIGVTSEGRLVSLPLLLPGYLPCPERLPTFLLQLATENNWRNEHECFSHICQCIGNLFGRLSSSEDGNSKLLPEDQSLLQHALYPAFRRYLVPSEDLKSSVIEVTRLEKLYKVFERC